MALKGIKGYPGGLSEPLDEYRKELASPLHHRSLLRPRAQPPPDAVTLTTDWAFIVDCERNAQICTAAADFLRFMEVCMETPLQVVEPSDRKPGDKVVRLVLTPDDFDAPESYMIEIAETYIDVSAADANGLQYGLYELEENMRTAGGPFVPPAPSERRPWMETRILRSFYAPYYKNELMTGEDYYPEEYLNRLAHHRINGIWLHLRLRDIVPSAIFPEFGGEYEQTMPALRALVERAGRYGIKVFLYMLEPRNLDQKDPFWAAHPEVKGRAEGPILEGWEPTFAMCTTGTPTIAWLREASERLFREVPGLGGTFHITASEEHTHCFSHAYAPADEEPPYEATGCPRCRNRRAADVIAEIISAFEQGLHAVDPTAKIIVWNWSWEGPYGVAGEHEIITKLPENTILLLDFERGDVKKILGKDVPIDEYAQSFTGPSQRFLRSAGWAKERGMAVYGKFQFVNTHECADNPHTPLPGIVYDKFAGMRASGGSGMLGCWIFGNYPAMITDLAGRLYLEPFTGDRTATLRRLAADYFGAEAVDDIMEAWDLFAKAWDVYPFFIPMIYSGPHVEGPAFPWFLEPIHRPFPPSWLRDQPPGDNGLEQIFDADVLWWDECWATLIERWGRGLEAMERGFEKMAAPTVEQCKEYGVARVIYHQMVSVRNTYRFYVEREFMLRSDSAEERRAILGRLQKLIREEVGNADECLPYLEADSRIGWHSEAHQYLLSAEEVRKRVADLRKIAEETIPEWLAKGTGLVKPQGYEEPISEGPYKAIREKLQAKGKADLVKGIYPPAQG
jgi:hypothetical protein